MLHEDVSDYGFKYQILYSTVVNLKIRASLLGSTVRDVIVFTAYNRF